MHTGHSEYPGSARGGSSGQARKKHAVPDSSGEAYLSCPFVVVSFLRLVTNPQIFVQPSQVEEAWAFVDTLESRERAIRADIDPMTYRVFKHVCLVAKAVGNHIPDALLAATAIRHDATFVTADRGFGRFEGLACRFLDNS